jgi:hypothetical protein
MADNPAGSESEVPRSFPSVPPPQDLYQTSDIRFVMVELGKIGTKIDHLSDTVTKHTDKIGSLERTVDRVRTGAIVAGVVISASVGLFWWALGDRISTAVRTGLFPSENVGQSPPISPTVPKR